MGSFETLSRLETVFYHLGLESYCLGLDLGYTVLVLCLIETFIKTVESNANGAYALSSKVVVVSC